MYSLWPGRRRPLTPSEVREQHRRAREVALEAEIRQAMGPEAVDAPRERETGPLSDKKTRALEREFLGLSADKGCIPESYWTPRPPEIPLGPKSANPTRE